MKTVILERFDVMFKRRKDANERERLAEIERKDAILAARLAQGPFRLRRPKKEVDGRKLGLNAQKLNLLQQVVDVIGMNHVTRPELVKQLWVYIKAHDLQNPEDRRTIMCDEKLERIFKRKKVGMFEMNKLLSDHIFKPGEMTYTQTEGTSTTNIESAGAERQESPALQLPTSDDFDLSGSEEPPTKRAKPENGQTAVPAKDSSESEAE